VAGDGVVLPVFGLQVVQPVVEPPVQPALSQAAEEVKREQQPHYVEDPVEGQVRGHAAVSKSVQNPSPPSSAQVHLPGEQEGQSAEEEGRVDTVTCLGDVYRRWMTMMTNKTIQCDSVEIGNASSNSSVGFGWLYGTIDHLLGNPAQLHSDVCSGVSYSDHNHLLASPWLRRLVVATVEIRSRERVDT